MLKYYALPMATIIQILKKVLCVNVFKNREIKFYIMKNRRSNLYAYQSPPPIRGYYKRTSMIFRLNFISKFWIDIINIHWNNHERKYTKKCILEHYPTLNHLNPFGTRLHFVLKYFDI